jgi:hypothetical protein
MLRFYKVEYFDEISLTDHSCTGVVFGNNIVEMTQSITEYYGDNISSLLLEEPSQEGEAPDNLYEIEELR